MASSHNFTQITWSAANSITLSANTTQTSDAFTFNVEDWEAEIQLSADNAGTPASGDYVDFWIAYTSGDVLGDTGDDYDTTLHAEPLWRLDTFTEDPARKTIPIRTGPKGFKILCKGNQAATRNVVVRVAVQTHRPQ